MSDGNLREALVFPENLYWAWERVRRFYRRIDGCYDELAVAQFEANLERELRNICKDLERGHYRMQPMRPCPSPKRPIALESRRRGRPSGSPFAIRSRGRRT